jgi:hypothetical protein
MINEYGSVGGMRTGRGNQSTQRKRAPEPLPTTNPTWPDLGSNLGHNSGILATSCLSYNTDSKREEFAFLLLQKFVMQNGILIIQKRLHEDELTDESQNKELVNYVNGLLGQLDTKVSEETNISHCDWYNTEPASRLKFLVTRSCDTNNKTKRTPLSRS